MRDSRTQVHGGENPNQNLKTIPSDVKISLHAEFYHLYFCASFPKRPLFAKRRLLLIHMRSTSSSKGLLQSRKES